MSIRARKIVSLITCLTLAVTLASCSTPDSNKPTHKPKTSVCLIKGTKSTPGSPERTLAANIVEAQVVFGIKAKEVEIPSGSSVSTRLLGALQAGCVLMVSSNTDYLKPLVTFAKAHQKMMVLFVGGSLDKAEQPKNFRYLADDVPSAASLAGFYAGELGKDVYLYVQSGYFQAKEIQSAFARGVREYSQVSGDQVRLSVNEVKSAGDLTQSLAEVSRPAVVSLFAGRSIWKGITDYEGLKVIGADLQFGQTRNKIDANVQASVERSTSLNVLRAVSALLARKLGNTPAYRKDHPLAEGLVELRATGSLSDQLVAYKTKLISQQKD